MTAEESEDEVRFRLEGWRWGDADVARRGELRGRDIAMTRRRYYYAERSAKITRTRQVRVIAATSRPAFLAIAYWPFSFQDG